MANIPERVDSKYRYVLLASKRAEQLLQGASPKIDAEASKPTRMAMSEISEDLVVWDYGPAEEPDEEIGQELEGEVDEAEVSAS